MFAMQVPQEFDQLYCHGRHCVAEALPTVRNLFEEFIPNENIYQLKTEIQRMDNAQLKNWNDEEQKTIQPNARQQLYQSLTCEQCSKGFNVAPFLSKMSVQDSQSSISKLQG